MKTRLFHLLTLLVLLAGLVPATAAFADGDDDGDYEFYGTVEDFPAGFIGEWLVDDGIQTRSVFADAFTRVEPDHGPVGPNACVEVKGWLRADGLSVDATKIETKEPWKCTGGGGGGGGGQRVEFYGTITTPDPLCRSAPCTWMVSGWTVNLTPSIIIEEEHGRLGSGAYVEVKGTQTASFTVDATKIEVKIGAGGGPGGGSYMKFYGTIDYLPAYDSFSGTWPGTWQVDVGGSIRAVSVDSATRIEQEHGPVALNAYVEVKGWLAADGTTVNATKIEVKSSPGGGSGGGGGYTKFYGTIGSLPCGTPWRCDWTVSGRAVHVDANTRIEQEHGAPAVGAYVEVKGWLAADGTTVNATKIEVKSSPGGGSGGGGGYTKFYGTIGSLPCGTPWRCDWTVSGRTVHVDAATRIEQEHGAPAVGAYVEVEGYLQATGSVSATKIEVKSSTGNGGSVGYVKFYGVIDDLSVNDVVNDWSVSDRLVHVGSARIEQEHGAVRIGAYVEVKGIQQTDGSINATKIEVKN